MKTSRFFLLSFTLLICLLFPACTPEPKLPRLADDAVILAFGDSLTYGTGAQPEENYPAVLERLTGRRVINAGVPGEVTSEGLIRLPDVLNRTRPNLLLLCHGGNDFLRHLDQQMTRRNLEAMIHLARNRGVAVVLIAVPAPGFLLRPPSFYEEIADKQKLPLEKEILEDILSEGTLKADYIHPNASGYKMFAETIRDLLRKSGALD
ncbi:MAG: arylesterase [Syntrophaceae bacterium]|nr:arylesterase [Syntrophaceae bacterium]